MDLPIGQCIICLNEAAEFVANKVQKQELSHEQAAKELGVSLPAWVAHFELHIHNKLVTAIATDVTAIKDNFMDKVKLAHESLTRLINTTEKIHKKLESGNNLENTRLIMAYAALEKNVITGLKECGMLEGDFKTATTINIQQNILKVDAIMDIVMQVATPDIQEKILTALSEIKVEPTTIA